VNKFKEWMDTWLLQLNVKKCKTVSFCRRTDILSEYTVSGKAVEKVDKIKDLGVTFGSRLKFDEHIDIKINKAYQMLGITRRNFIYLTAYSFVILYKALVRSQLEHAVSVWSPHHKLLIEKYKKGPQN